MHEVVGVWVAEQRGPVAGGANRRASWVFDPDGQAEARWDDDGGSHAARLPWLADGEVVRAGIGPDAVLLRLRGDVLEVGEKRFRRVPGDVKQVIVYRRDLQMRKGKIAAQVAHASMKVLLDRDEGPWDRLEIPLDPVMAAWARARFAKIVLSVEDEDALVRAYELARAAGIPTALVIDAGRTEFHGVPTRTTVALGPARAAQIDAITGPEGAVPTKLA